MRRGADEGTRARPTAVGGVTRGIAVMALAWQGGWMITDAPLREAAVAVGAGIPFAVAFACWAAIAVLLAMRARERLVSVLCAVDAAALSLSAVLLLVADARDKGSSGTTLVLLAIGVSGLLLPARAALPIAGGLLVVEVALLAYEVRAGGILEDPRTLLLAPAYAAAVAVAVIAGRFFSIAAARRSDAAAEELVAVEARARALRAIEAELLGRERLLHETALNTLTAVARGGSWDRAVLARRCRESAAAIEHMTDASPGAEDRDVARGLARARAAVEASGARVDLVVEEGGLDGVPDAVARAVIGALREALLNTARHARASTVTVRLAREGRALRAEVEDDGLGFADSDRDGGRFGIPQAIVAAMEGVGGTAEVTSDPGTGTRITVRWRASRAEPDLPTGANGVALPILVGFLSFAALSMVATIGLADRPVLDVLALAAALGIAALALPLGRIGTLPAWRTLLVCALAPLPYVLQSAAFTGEAGSAWADWGAEAMVGILLTVACIGPWWAWVPALASWLLAMGDPLAELLRPGTIVILGGALFARSVRRSHRAHVRALERRVDEDAAAEAAEASVLRIERRYAGLRDSGAAALLSSIADGQADPDDPAVRARCADEEHALRTLMRLDPAQPLHALASAVVVTGGARGLRTEVDLASGIELGAGDLDRMRVACEAAVAAADPGEPARLSARREGEAIVLRFVAVAPAPLAPVAGVTTHRDATDGSIMLEARFARGNGHP